MVLLQAPDHAADLARACVGLSGRAVTGLSGPLEQVQPARSALQIDAADLALDGADGLYAVDLSELIVPEVATVRVALRPGQATSLPFVIPRDVSGPVGIDPCWVPNANNQGHAIPSAEVFDTETGRTMLFLNPAVARLSARGLDAGGFGRDGHTLIRSAPCGFT